MLCDVYLQRRKEACRGAPMGAFQLLQLQTPSAETTVQQTLYTTPGTHIYIDLPCAITPRVFSCSAAESYTNKKSNETISTRDSKAIHVQLQWQNNLPLATADNHGVARVVWRDQSCTHGTIKTRFEILIFIANLLESIWDSIGVDGLENPFRTHAGILRNN